MRKRMTLTIERVERGEIKGQKIAHGKGRGIKVKFDVLEDLFSINEGEKILLEIRDSPPSNLKDYLFCGHGYVVREPKKEAFEEYNFTILSVWGILFRFEPKINELETNKKYYICIKKP